MEKWSVKNIKFDYSKFSKQLGVSEILSKLLVNRGIHTVEEAKEYLDSKVSHMYPAKDMYGVTQGVELMKSSIDNKQKILIVGDYDVDGVISTLVLYKSLTRLGANVSYHIPDRVTEGYGINESIIRNAKADNIDLIITCDNGISAIDQIKLARELGINVIITDHHDVPFDEVDGKKNFKLPEANVVINPKQKECNYPFKSLCGAAVAYKFIEALFEEYKIDNKEVVELLQYVAIATVCDVVDLMGENRIIVKEGLRQINETDNIGLKELFKVTGLEDKTINVYALGFVIGPSINASGRLEQATWALKLFLCDNKLEAKELAEKLDNLNKERQELTRAGLEEAIEKIESANMQKEKVIVVYIPEVHESIAGIIAGRIREKYNLPAIVLTAGHDGAKGSGRSIEEYNLFEEMTKCKELLGKFGGHPLAAGMSIPTDNIDLFREKINSICTLSDDDIMRKVSIDMAVKLEDINYNLIDEISKLEPYGKGNSKPKFGVRGLRVKSARILGANKNTLKLTLTDGRLVIDAISFGNIEEFEKEIKEHYGEVEYSNLLDGQNNNVKLDLVYYPDINEYMGRKTVQLKIESFRVNK